MKKTLLTLLIATAATAAHADDYAYPYLDITTAGGSTTRLAVADLRFTVSGSSLVATNAEGTHTFTLAELASMQFADGTATSAIAQTTSPAAQGPVSVSALTGVSMGIFESLQTARRLLRPGIYVVKTETETYKITVK